MFLSVRHAGIREAAGLHADQVLRVLARGSDPVHRAPVRHAGGRRGIRRAHRALVTVHTRGRRAQVQRVVRVAAREPNADRSQGRRRHAHHPRTRARRGRGPGQGDEHVLLQPTIRLGRGPAERRPVRPAGRGARGELAAGR